MNDVDFGKVSPNLDACSGTCFDLAGTYAQRRQTKLNFRMLLSPTTGGPFRPACNGRKSNFNIHPQRNIILLPSTSMCPTCKFVVGLTRVPVSSAFNNVPAFFESSSSEV